MTEVSININRRQLKDKLSITDGASGGIDAERNLKRF